MVLLLRIVFCIFLVCEKCCHSDGEETLQPPHIIIIMADDMGWNDVSFHNSNLFLTPNIDALAYNGIILNQFYTASLCTPSRSSLMTGKFPINIGMQHSVILEAEPWGLPIDLKILPQYLNSVGYESHLIGKWHLGFYERKYTPTYRGFKSFFGIWQGHHDYYTHKSHETFGDFVGYDLHEDLWPRQDLEDFYTTDLLGAKSVHVIQKHDPAKPLFLMLAHVAPHAGEPNDPFQAPEAVIENFSYIDDEDKRKYAAMVSKVDESVGDVVRALSEKDMLKNSIVLFMSDNGAPTFGIYGNTGSNYPFRSMKFSEFEGGTRVPAFIWSPLFQNQQRVSNIMMHIADVLPTLCTAAGVSSEDTQNLDGISMWETLMEASEQSPRTEYPYNIDPAEPHNAAGAVRVGHWKYYRGDGKESDERFLWPGDKMPNSEHVKFGYDTAQILYSPTNTAIVDLYNRGEDINRREPLDTGKILQLRAEAKVECPSAKDLPTCDATKSCLLNLNEDPCERYDYAAVHPEVLENLTQKFEEYRRKVATPRNQPRDPCANPEYWNGAWTTWNDFDMVFESMSIRGKHWRWSYLRSFVWHYRESALCRLGNFKHF